MLYLVKLDNTYKIGFSDNIENRLKSFTTSHPVVELVSSRFGGKTEEKILHNLCKNFCIRGEVFEISEEVVKIFNETNLVNLAGVDSLIEENNKLRREIEKLNKKLQEYQGSIKEVTLINPNKIIEKELLRQTGIIKFIISYYNEYIKFGNLLYYDIMNDKFLSGLGIEAKKYTTKNNTDIYYIDYGVALSVRELKELINK